MKILIIMDPGILIPVTGYGGHERLVEIFAKEYKILGHEVHLLITNGSYVEGCTIHDFGKSGFPPLKKDARKAILKAWFFLQKNHQNFDLIHNFGRLIYLLPIINKRVKKIMTYGREITGGNINKLLKLPHRNIVFTGCSTNLISRSVAKGKWEAVYNAIDFSKYAVTVDLPEDAPLIFLGRIERIKGCHTAIAVAKATNNKLIIAGNISPLKEEKQYFENEIKPHIDGKQIIYVGEVNDAQKNDWLGKSKALMMPIEWNEPFGIVMIEAMACGTPVLAFDCGSVNEVVDEGKTGFKIYSQKEMIASVYKLASISREQCAAHAKKRFDVPIIAKQYLRLFVEQPKSVVIISTHQPAANPRAMKEYETLKEEGFKVTYLYAYNTAWSYKIDEEKFQNKILSRTELVEVGGNPYNKSSKFFFSRLSHKIFKIASFLKPIKLVSFDRVAFPLLLKAKRYKADLYIAHYLGALPAALKAAKKWDVPVIFDAEDFHRGEKDYYKDQKKDIIMVEDTLLPKVSAITTASPLISEEYKKYYPQQNILTVNNVFSKRFLQSKTNNIEPHLKLFWFSQHIGIGRGLEIFIKALDYLPHHNISLTIMGNVKSEEYNLKLLNGSSNPGKIIFKDTVPPEDIFKIAAEHDIGLAGEISNFTNKELCLTNKIFTYLLAGNCVLASDMRGQKIFMEQHPSIGFTYKHNDAKDLAEKIKTLYEDRALLNFCKSSSKKLAENHFNWEVQKVTWIKLIRTLLYKKE